MITYKTSPERIISILKEITSLNRLKVNVTDYDEESIKLKGGQFDFTINCKKKNKETTVLIDCNYTGSEKIGDFSGLTDAIIKFINDNLNEDEYTDNSRNLMENVAQRGKKRTKLFMIGIVGGLIIGVILIWVIDEIFSPADTLYGTSNQEESRKKFKQKWIKSEADVKSAILKTNWYGKMGFRQYGGTKWVKYKFNSDGTWAKWEAWENKDRIWSFSENGHWKTVSWDRYFGVDMYPNKMRGKYRMDTDDQLYNITNTPTCYSKEWYEDAGSVMKFGW